MDGVQVSVEPDAINKYIADKILESALGERLNETIESALKELGRYGNDPLKNAVTAEVNKHIMNLVTTEFGDKIRESVKAKMTDEFIDQLVAGFVSSITARLDGRF